VKFPQLLTGAAGAALLMCLTGCSGFSSGSQNTNLTPDFTLAVTPTAASVAQGSSTSVSASVAPQDGFSGIVQLSVSGLPAGATASFSSSTVNGSGNPSVTITASKSVPAGKYSLTVSGASGTLTHSADVALTVSSNTPDFSLSATPSSQSIAAGNSVSFSATIAPTNGFTGSVTLGASGLPSGVTASFSPASITTSGTSTLTLTSTKSTVAGTYPLTVSGTSGTLVHSSNISLAVSAAQAGAALNVLQFPGASGDPWFKDVVTYLQTNSVVNGATIGVEWGGSDQGPSAGSSQYDWSYPDSQAQSWIQAGKKVNFVVWANADDAGTTCNTWGQYGSNNTGNCAIPSYVWTALGASNITTCNTSYGTQQMPNYLAAAFQDNYKNFMAAMVQHYANDPNVGYIRFGLGHGGESLPVANWNDTTTSCGQAYVNTWGLTIQTWEGYLSSMLNYEGSLGSPVQLMVGVTPMGNPGSQVPDYAAPIAVQNGIGFGSQGLQKSDVNNCAGATADWCELFAQYTGQVPLELQTYLQSCPDNSCTTGSLVNLIPFAVANHATIFEIYYQDWLTAYDPNYPGYFPAYQPVFAAAAGQ
jgi:hypothetical protein